jgi:hypothetical protein
MKGKSLILAILLIITLATGVLGAEITAIPPL